jgi:hypothetical protein
VESGDEHPLAELLVAFSYSTLPSCETTTKPIPASISPCTPMLAAMLAEGNLGGRAAMMGAIPNRMI